MQLINLLKDETGATAIEYGLIAALIGITCIGAMTAVSVSLKSTFNTVTSDLNSSAR